MTATAGPPSPFRVALAGAGRVGTAVAELLRRGGHEVIGVASRTDSSAARAAEVREAPVVAWEAVAGADVVLIGAHDDAIESVAARLSSGLAPNTVLWHFAGSLGVTPLRPGVAAGALRAALHPVQACPDVDTALAHLPGSAWGVTCAADLRDWARRVIIDDLEGFPVDVPERDRPVWHAAAVTTSNGIAALLELGESMLKSIGVERPQHVLAPLAEGTVINAREGGGGGATLTGPAVRGDVGTIERHVDALRAAPRLLESYVRVTRLVLAGGRRAGRLDEEQAAAIGRLLEARL